MGPMGETLSALRETWESEWQAPGSATFVFGSAAFALLALVAARSEQGWVPILDSANLVFDEAGHPLFGQNWLNVARYMADARAQLLPLVGGGEHDWNALFARWGLLPHDTAIAGSVSFLGWTGMLACWCWLAWRWHRGRVSVARR